MNEKLDAKKAKRFFYTMGYSKYIKNGEFDVKSFETMLRKRIDYVGKTDKKRLTNEFTEKLMNQFTKELDLNTNDYIEKGEYWYLDKVDTKKFISDVINQVTELSKMYNNESVNEVKLTPGTFIPNVGTFMNPSLKNLILKNSKISTAIGNDEKSFMKKSDVVPLKHYKKPFNTIFTNGKQEFEVDMKKYKLVKPLTKARTEISNHYLQKESVNESTVTITKQDMDRLHSGEEVDIDGHLLKFVDESVNEGIGTIALGVVGGYLLLKTLKFVFKKVYRGIGMNVKLSTDNLHTIKDKVFKQLLKKAENDPIKKVKLLSFFDTAKEQIENHIDSGKITTVKQLQNELEKIVKLASKNEPTNESLNENKNIGHYEFVGNQILVDSNFVNYSKGVIPNSKLVHLGMGDFALKSSEGTIEFDRVDKIAGIGQDFVGRFHRMDDDKNGKLVGMLLKLMKKNKRAILSMSESVNEDEQLDEKLITFSNRAPYGQVVFMAGGAGSGKGFAISNFIDSAGFKVRDVDEMKKQVGKLDKLGKISVDSWYKRYSGNLSPDAREHVEKYVINKGLTISDIAGDLKNPNNVASLHFIVDAMGIKEKWLINMLSGKNNPETLPNLIFDITAKNIKSITKTIPALISQGYKPQNIHLIWVLTNYYIAVQQNQKRERVVPDDIMLKSHEGAARTIWSIVTGSLPKGLNGRIDVILGGAKNTVMYTDSNGNELKGAVKGFTTLPVKKQGGGILPEKQWLNKLYKWVSNNTPKTITLQKPLDTQMEKLDESMNEGTGIHSKVRNWRNSKIKKPSGVKDLETMLDYLVNQGKLTGDEAKTLSHYSYNEVSDAVRDFYLNKRGDAFFRRYYMQ